MLGARRGSTPLHGSILNKLNKTTMLKYNAKNGRRISESVEHPELFIVDCADGKTFYTIHTSAEIIFRENPPAFANGLDLNNMDRVQIKNLMKQYSE